VKQPIPAPLGDVKYELVPSLAAAVEVSKALGGIRPAMDRIQDVDVDAIVTTFQIGVRCANEEQRRKAFADLEEHGFLDVVEPLAEFLAQLLGNSSKQPEGETEGKS